MCWERGKDGVLFSEPEVKTADKIAVELREQQYENSDVLYKMWDAQRVRETKSRMINMKREKKQVTLSCTK